MSRVVPLSSWDSEMSARLCLRNSVASFADLNNGARLNGGGGFVAVRIDSSKQILLQVHGFESGSYRDLFGGGELHLVVGVAIDAVRHVG